MTAWLPIQADAQAPDPTDSATLTAVKAALADLLSTDLAYLQLKAYAGAPTTITQTPCAIIYWVAPGLQLQTISSPDAQLEADLEFGATLEIAILSDPMAGDTIRLVDRAEAWIDPVFRALHKNFALGGTVWSCTPVSVMPGPIKFNSDPAAPPEWFGPVFRITTELLYTYPRHA